MNEEIIIDRVISVRAGGGAIFIGNRYDGSTVRVLADRQVMPRPPIKGEIWLVDGADRHHRTYGPQVIARTASLVRPSGRLLVDFLAANPAFPGVGRSRANRLWTHFGDELPDALDGGDPSLFSELIGDTAATQLIEGWRTHRAEAETLNWLDRHGFSRGLSNKLIAIWGADTPQKLLDNPYRMLAFAPWSATDRAALSMGLACDDPRRLVAGAEAACYQRLAAGHTSASRDRLVGLAAKLLGCSDDLAEQAVDAAISDRAIVQHGEVLQPLGPWAMETFVTSRMIRLAAPSNLGSRDLFATGATGSAIQAAETAERTRLNAQQREAVEAALEARLSVVTGGAGVGKTVALRVLCSAAEQLGIQVLLMALAGRAASRLREATGRRAYTIAAFLNALRQDKLQLSSRHLIVVDEASMLDLPLAYRILRSLPQETAVVLVGDPHQLPPIGFGLVLHVVANAALIRTTVLTQIYRQTEETGIPSIAAAVKDGVLPTIPAFTGEVATGVSLVDAPEATIASEAIRVFKQLGGNPHARIVGPLRNGPIGTDAINQRCHDMMTASPLFQPGEPVMFQHNDYDRGLFNGSLGEIITNTDGFMRVAFDEGDHEFYLEDQPDIRLAYAITAHKAQGSSFRRVIIPVVRTKLLDRTMLYTAITRATDQVVLVGSRQLLLQALLRPTASASREVGLTF